MSREQRNHQQYHSQRQQTFEVALRGRKRPNRDAPNSLRFLVAIEGVEEYDGRVRSSNGMRWKVV